MSRDPYRDHLRLLRQEEERLLRIIKQAEKEIAAKILKLKSYGSGLTRANYESIKKELHFVVGTLTASLDKRINISAGQTASDFVEAYERTLFARMKSAGVTISVSFDMIPVRAVRAALKTAEHGMKLSDSLYNFQRFAKQDLEDIIIGGIARKQSAEEIARSSRKFFRDADKFTPEELADFRKVTGSRRDMARKISYRAKRLSSSSINNAYHRAQTESGIADPTVIGQKWNLSGSHRMADECDLLATQDSYGLGPGVYPTNRVPYKPHPKDFCFLTTFMRNPEEWLKPKPDIILKKGWEKIPFRKDIGIRHEDKFFAIVKAAA